MRLSLRSLLSVTLCTLAWNAVISAAAPVDTASDSISKRDADFRTVRTRLKSDHSGRKGDERTAPGKYFHEST